MELQIKAINLIKQHGFSDDAFYIHPEIMKVIQSKTDEVAGDNKGIVDKPIILSIYSKDCPDEFKTLTEIKFATQEGKRSYLLSNNKITTKFLYISLDL